MALEKQEHTVTQEDTAVELHSGDLPVLATPRLINWLERAAFAVARRSIEPDQTTVGTLVKVEHLKGAPVGSVVTCCSSKPISDGRRLIFHVTATDERGDEVAIGEIQRRVVDPDRFMARFTETDAEPEGPH
ncbi:MAG: thioesterase family protein [Dermatophilaceae bacterium]